MKKIYNVYTEENQMESAIQKWGNSLGVRIPSNLAKELELKDGSHIELIQQNGKIIISPKGKNSLKDLLKNITKDNLHAEVKSDGPIGNEAW